MTYELIKILQQLEDAGLPEPEYIDQDLVDAGIPITIHWGKGDVFLYFEGDKYFSISTPNVADNSGIVTLPEAIERLKELMG